MDDPLTVREVRRHVKLALQALYALPLPANAPRLARARLDDALAQLHELEWLCELVEAVDSGLVVTVEREGPPPP